ncbi:hypothetical protein P10159_0089 [Citrobacter portucalensis]|nr:hypothetical protein P10159_0089 [Citrobacter portucalensis]
MKMKKPIKSTQLRGFLFSQHLNSSRHSTVKNEYILTLTPS